MRDLEKLTREGQAAAIKTARLDLCFAEVHELMDTYLEETTERGKVDAAYNLMMRAYYAGISAGMRHEKNRARKARTAAAGA